MYQFVQFNDITKALELLDKLYVNNKHNVEKYNNNITKLTDNVHNTK